MIFSGSLVTLCFTYFIIFDSCDDVIMVFVCYVAHVRPFTHLTANRRHLLPIPAEVRSY